MASWRIGLLVGLLAAGSVFVTVWFAAATTARRGDAPVPGILAPAPPPAAVAAAVARLDEVPNLAESIARLQEHLERAEAPRIGARNPFAFGRETAGAAPAPAVADSSSASPAAVHAADGVFRAAPVDRFGLILSGIATTNTGGGGVEHTAILTARTGDVLLVRVGDSLPGNWRIVSVTRTSVALEESTGATRRLELP